MFFLLVTKQDRKVVRNKSENGMEFLFKIRVRMGWKVCSKEGRKRGQKICAKGDRNGEGYIYKFDNRLGLSRVRGMEV